MRHAGDPAGRGAGRVAAADCGRRRDQRAGQCGHADPHCRRDGRGGGDPGREQRRPIQRQMPACFRRQHLFDSRRRRTRCRRGTVPRCAAPGCRCWRPRWTASCVSTRPTSCWPPTAWLFGPESHGLSAEIAEQADHQRAHPDVRRRREPECGCRRGDLPVPERAGAGCAQAALRCQAAFLLRPLAGRKPASESVVCISDPARSNSDWAGRERGGK